MHPVTAGVRLHGGAIRLLYRVITPRHPRGWLDFHAFGEDAGTLWIHCHGMERWQLPNLEMIGVPVDLRGPAHGLLCEMLGYMRTVKPMNADENFGGNFVGGEQQAVVHLGTLRPVPDRDAAHVNLLRVVDYKQPTDAGFPAKLMATHLCALADVAKSPREAERLVRRAVEIFPGDFAADVSGAEDAADFLGEIQHETNLYGWERLGTCLAGLGRFDEAIACYEQAVARCPAWGRHYATFFLGQAGASLPDQHPIMRFWAGLDADAVRRRVRS
jgi:hypothetical protein